MDGVAQEVLQLGPASQVTDAIVSGRAPARHKASCTRHYREASPPPTDGAAFGSSAGRERRCPSELRVEVNFHRRSLHVELTIRALAPSFPRVAYPRRSRGRQRQQRRAHRTKWTGARQQALGETSRHELRHAAPGHRARLARFVHLRSPAGAKRGRFSGVGAGRRRDRATVRRHHRGERR